MLARWAGDGAVGIGYAAGAYPAGIHTVESGGVCRNVHGGSVDGGRA